MTTPQKVNVVGGRSHGTPRKERKGIVFNNIEVVKKFIGKIVIRLKVFTAKSRTFGFYLTLFPKAIYLWSKWIGSSADLESGKRPFCGCETPVF